jgi:hypothetical protein
LLYSLQLLFEDRLGFDLYVPVGYEWWHEGYWQFGKVFGDARLADQYLAIDAAYGSTGGDGNYVTYDRAHPHRPIFAITLDEVRANASEWAFVVATVQENQHGFKRLADELGAKYVLQVGNNNQQVDWDLDPLALVSSSAPIPDGRRGVHYHQEFDLNTFAFSEPSDPEPLSLQVPLQRRIASFVNCMPSIANYSQLELFQRELGNFSFRVHGIDGPAGNLSPTAAIAEAMALHGWGWHDKPQGDGFGHVLHGWAAIGRPLIGHASHYTGCLGAYFWQDLVTCIDLDQRSDGENVALIRAISLDRDRHAEMCFAIRRRFDEHVDFGAEKDEIRELLESG